MENISCWTFLGALLDDFLILFVHFPLAIFYWRGTWHLQDYYIYPENETISSWITLIFGSFFGIILVYIHPLLFSRIKFSSKRVYIICSRLYMYVNGWAILGFWRGSWNLTDYYLTEEWKNSLATYIMAQTISMILRTGRTNNGLPLSIQVDSEEELNKTDLRYSTKDPASCRFFLDAVVTLFVIVTCNMLVWRGIWNIIDAFLIPEDKLLSDVVSLVLGYILVIGLFIFEYPAAVASSRLDNKHVIFKLVFEGAFTVAGTWYIMLMWRGAWDLVREYFIPDKRLGGWVCHLIGSSGLMLLGVYSNVGTNGIDIDGSYMEGSGMYPLEYLRVYFSNYFPRPQNSQKVLIPESEELQQMTELIIEDSSSGDDEETEKLMKLLTPVS